MGVHQVGSISSVLTSSRRPQRWDSDADRRIDIDDFVRILSTYRVSAEQDSGFAGDVDVF